MESRGLQKEASSSSSRQRSVSRALSVAPGDRDANEEDLAEEGKPAVAGDPAMAGDGHPLQTVATAPKLRSAVFNDRPDVGNIGCFLSNWGKRAANTGIQENIDAQI